MTLTDDLDGSPDGSVVIGGTMTSNIFGTVTVVAVTTDGEPIIQPSSGFLYLVTNGVGPNEIATFSTSSPFVTCFAEGTLLQTPNGVKTVNEVSIGDEIASASGEWVPVKWIGRQTVSKLFAGPKMQPVRFRAGALGNGLPHSDLTVTADHGMIMDAGYQRICIGERHVD